jgi:hypothetical protein
MPHPCGNAGLILNTVGAFGLLRFVPNPDADAPSPHENDGESAADDARTATRQSHADRGLPRVRTGLGSWFRLAAF